MLVVASAMLPLDLRPVSVLLRQENTKRLINLDVKKFNIGAGISGLIKTSEKLKTT